jgi:O-antigen/teichoic acid export membrane protein
MSVARNTAVNVAGGIVPMAVTLVTVPIYLSVIGIERYAVLSIAWLLLGYFGLFDFGLGRAAAQRIARLAESSPKARSDVFWTALWLNAALGVIGAFVLLPIGYSAFGAMRDMTGPLAEEASAAVPWIAATLPVATVTGVLRGALQGRERFIELNVIGSIATALGSTAPLLVAIYHGPELSWLIAAALLARLFSTLLFFHVSRGIVPAAAPRLPQWRLVRDLLSFGGWITVSSIVGPLLASFDRFVIGVIVSAAAVTHYVVPFNLISHVWILPRSLSSALFPRFAALASGDEADRLELDALKALTLVITPAVLFGILTVEPFLVIWLGQDLAAVSAPVAHILVLGFWVNSAAHIPSSSLQGRGRPDLVAMAHLGELAPYMAVLALCLYAFGLEGAALAWTIRVTADAAILFGLDRSLQPAIRLLAVPAALVAGAVGAVLLLPLGSPERWILLGILDALALLWWVLNVPAEWRQAWASRLLRRSTLAARGPR